ncbi:MAG: 5-formyltetrahydrofolate cyclo-ligase [Chloroflexus sp.]|jgi:5-formyltetrahydrofolate cyclo-ligase|uniref:5-formyltetrahydrofolate cyclo-ligase n=1 Tax=Chloroflexus sp. TaxID=1904827 RepID=UPI000F16C45E|nr:5-formyltetrahydrofolate cyclo-ligase [Chloroflexus sp.]RMD76195.1 MAG: 5-formyltetrahydrofolate cyclo-ligase [Chloroflexota bacterium]GIV90651.1 MAG: 5-formyltetrahydrofolate cyclo-ligase [Chloroflexus sp.]GIV91280.1 MAG: 5-formyltetrahydrofolate cyclo-ligase [Chloroflexus sp.]
MTNIATEKAALRAKMMILRDTLPEREQRSGQICALVQTLSAFATASAIHCYFPMRSEVDTRPLIAAALAAGKAVAVPIVVGRHQLEHSWIDSLAETEWVRGRFGTLQPRQIHPAHPGEWSVTIVPLLAFDRDRYRLGYGGGYYDMLLATAPTLAVGVAFAAQEIERLPREAHDYQLDLIVCEDGIRGNGRFM